ncbi:hypothetical protein POM88_025975 [Heracleum sosnowskyi]|uniref:TF-B3 domain-containing protein n=1 Tax=Heracleum sosnowskyi TaxID=360622 RepID=A0AAD8I5K3_9APIA|nr:hypothetical protein POM88_025967 [Heracleum sosnowskyi]KAK1379231.1 hypothetical protein POM88_025975 [Heracleum sosnowskyi]
MLPPQLSSNFLQNIPENVYLRVRNGDAWCAYYRRHDACLVRLGAMINFYRLKPYNVILIKYKGDGNFNMEIFNNDNIEIYYPRRMIGLKKPRLTLTTGSTLEESRGDFSNIEVEKMAARFFYNASSNSRLSYDVIIQNEHLQNSNLLQVLSDEAISKLRLHDEMTWIQLRLQESKRVINLIWQNGQVFFNEEWIKFTKTLNLKEGDICVISRSMQFQNFNVAIFEKNEGSTENEEGSGRSDFKCFKILSADIVAKGEMEIPRQFIKFYGPMLSKKVNILLPDGSTFKANFCKVNNLLFGLKNLFSKYGLGESFFLFLGYVSPSNLYLSVYSPFCLDIFNDNPNKMSLKDIRKHFVLVPNDAADSTAESSEDSSETSSANMPHLETLVTSYEYLYDSISYVSVHSSQEDSFHSLHNNSVPNNMLEATPTLAVDNTGHVISFTVTLTSSHVDQKGHGVYFARHMLRIYSTWKNGTKVTLLYDQGFWNVVVHRKKKL